MPHMTTAERIGRQDGRKEGKIEGKVELLLGQLEAKFGSLPESKVAVLQSMRNTQLDRISIRLLTVDTLDELIP